MSRIYNPTPEQEAGWRAWVAERPEAVRAVAERFDPWSLYRIKGAGNRVTVYSYDEGEKGEPVTLTVIVSGEFNAVMFERHVFGVKPEDLEPCDPPAPDEPTGVIFTEPQDVDGYLDTIRPGRGETREAT